MIINKTPRENNTMNTIKYKEPQAAFEAAIKSGRLTRTPAAPNYAGAYMYMGTTAAGDLFKNVNTRAYLPQNGLEPLERLAAGTPAILAATTHPVTPEDNSEAAETR